MFIMVFSITAILLATFALGYITAAAKALMKKHVVYFKWLSVVFFTGKSIGFASILLERYYEPALYARFFMNIIDLGVDIGFYCFLLFFLNSFYGIITVRKAVIITSLYFIEPFLESVGLSSGLVLNDTVLAFIKNVSSIPFLCYISYITLRLVFKTADRLLKRLLIYSAIILGSISAVTFIDGLLETLTSIDLPKDAIHVIIYSLASLLYMNSIWEFFLKEDDPAIDAYVEKYSLTKREAEIINYLMEGNSYKSIAYDLSISLPTVKTHIHNIYTKTGAEGRFDLLSSIRLFTG